MTTPARKDVGDKRGVGDVTSEQADIAASDATAANAAAVLNVWDMRI